MHHSQHLPDWMLDLLAEDALSHAERSAAEAHLRECARCAGELDATRSVIASLDALPRLAPSPGFADAVMARVVPQEAAAAAPARARRWLPHTRKGWMQLGAALLVPLAPLATLLAWLLAQPMVTPGALWGVGTRWMGDTAWSMVARLAELVARSGAVGWLGAMADRIAAAPTQTGLALLAAGIAIPLSAWTLARILRTPTGGVTHAY